MVQKRHTEDLYLALDQGGHSSRALVLDASGTVYAQAQISVSTSRHNERVEQDPEELVDSLKQCCAEVANALGKDVSRLKSAGLATQRSSALCWKKSSGIPLSPVLSWQDRRAWQFVESIASEGNRITDITGLVLSPHYGASKLRWCLRELEAVKQALDKNELVLGPLSSFLTRQLTVCNRNLCDPANASRTQLWDRRAKNWSKALCELFEVGADLLPALVSTRFDFGGIKLGEHEVPLEIVTGDQSAAIYAFGEPDPTTLYINMGTGAFLQVACGSQCGVIPGLLISVIYQDTERAEYVAEGTVNGAGSALTWLGEQLGRKDILGMIAEGIEEAAMSSPPVFINGIGGLGSPFWVKSLESGFSAEASAGLKALAVLESIAFLIAENLGRMRADGRSIERIVLTGGLSAENYLCQTIAEITKLRVGRSSVREATALGLTHLLARNQSCLRYPDLAEQFKCSGDAGVRHRYQLWQAEMGRLV